MIFRLLRAIPLLTAILTICYSYWSFIFLYCDRTLKEQEPLQFLFYHLLLVLFTWSYFQTTTTEPPDIPGQFFVSESFLKKICNADGDNDKIDALLSAKAKTLPIFTYTAERYIRFCNACALVKPDRTHHCSVCGHCVLKMDHHCPWLHNCVSFTNYKFYILFLGYGALYCAFTLYLLPVQLYKNWVKPGVLDEEQLYHYTVLTIAAVLFLAFFSGLFFYHIYLVLNNRTTLEAFREPMFSYGPDKHGFSLGAHRNFVEVFGYEKWMWFIPVFSSLGNGWEFEFPLRRKIEAAIRQEENFSTDVSETE